MGLSASDLNEEDIQEYQDITYLTKQEILHIYNRFYDMADDSQRIDLRDAVTRNSVRVSKEVALQNLWELEHNPFKDRILQVFSSKNDGLLSLDDFINMASVFCDAASRSLKTAYAFRIYDLSDTGDITHADLEMVIDKLTRHDKLTNCDDVEAEGNTERSSCLPKKIKEELVSTIIKEADLHQSGTLSLAEFEHLLDKAPDFIESFRIRF